MNQLKGLGSRWLGVVAVAIQLGTIGLVSAQTGFAWFGHRPISDLGLTSWHTFYSLSFVVAAACVWLFGHYLQERFHVGKWFLSLLAAGVASVILIGAVPDKPTINFGLLAYLWPLHWLAASVLFMSLPLMMKEFTATPGLPRRVMEVSRQWLRFYVVVLLFEVILLATFQWLAICELLSLLVFDAWFGYLSATTIAS